MSKSDKLAKLKPKQQQILELVKKGYTNSQICEMAGVKDHSIFYVKRRYADLIPRAQHNNNITNIVDNDESHINILKNIQYKIGNTILNKDLNSATLSQLSNTLKTVNEVERLMTGKSTANISTQIVHNLNPEQLDIIKESIKSLKKSMLSYE